MLNCVLSSKSFILYPDRYASFLDIIIRYCIYGSPLAMAMYVERHEQAAYNAGEASSLPHNMLMRKDARRKAFK